MSSRGISVLFLLCFFPFPFTKADQFSQYPGINSLPYFDTWQIPSLPSQNEEPPGTIPEEPEFVFEPDEPESSNPAIIEVVPQEEDIVVEGDSLFNEAADSEKIFSEVPVLEDAGIETIDASIKTTDTGIETTVEGIETAAPAENSLPAENELMPQDPNNTEASEEIIQYTELILKLDVDSTAQNYDALFEKYSIQVSNEIPVLGTRLITINSELSADFLNDISALGGFDYIEENFSGLTALEIPNDPLFSQQYGLEAINAPEGWSFTKSSEKVTIAVLDTGVDLDHPDLIGLLVAGYNILQGNDMPQDDNGHGTQVAGICTAVTDNGLGIAGSSWGASLMPVKVLDASGNGSFQNVADGIVWAVDHGAQILNLSLGGYSTSSVLEDAINYAIQKGAVVIAASGNGGINAITYPARYEQVIAVGSVDENGQQSAFSNYGAELDVVAPGSGILSLNNLGNYSFMSGTSAATPFTSGLAALLLSVPGNNSSKINSQLCRSALDLGAEGRDDNFGCGLIQADQAIKLAVIDPPPAKRIKKDPKPVVLVDFVSFAKEDKLATLVQEIRVVQPTRIPMRFRKIEEQELKNPGLSGALLPKEIPIESDKTGMNNTGLISLPVELLIFMVFLILTLAYLNIRARAK